VRSKQALIRRGKKEGIGVVKYKMPIRRKRNNERLCLTLKKAGKICLGDELQRAKTITLKL